RLLDRLADATAVRTRGLHHEEALRVHDLALALARAAHLGLAARRRAAALARVTRDRARDLHVLRAAPHRLGERQLEIDAQIRAARRALAARATAEEVAEQIAERGEDILGRRESGPRTTAAATDSVEAVAIVERALLVVRQDLVGVRRFLELLLGVLITAALVGVKLLREPAVGLLQVGLACAALDREYFM